MISLFGKFSYNFINFSNSFLVFVLCLVSSTLLRSVIHHWANKLRRAQQLKQGLET